LNDYILTQINQYINKKALFNIFKAGDPSGFSSTRGEKQKPKPKLV